MAMMLSLTLRQPMMVVVRAELYWVQRTVEKIRTKPNTQERRNWSRNIRSPQPSNSLEDMMSKSKRTRGQKDKRSERPELSPAPKIWEISQIRGISGKPIFRKMYNATVAALKMPQKSSRKAPEF